MCVCLLSLLLHLQESREDEVVLQRDVLFEIKEELPELLVHEMIGCAAVVRCLEVVCQFGDMLPHLACGIVLKHHLSDGVGDGSAMAGSSGPTLFLCMIHLVELWEENVLLLGEVAVEFLKRSGYSISHV